MLIPYALTIIFSFFGISLFLAKWKIKWTFASVTGKIIMILLASAFLSFFYNSLFWNEGYLTIKNFLNQFAYNSALGLPACALYLMGRYIYLTADHQPTAKTEAKSNHFLTENVSHTKIRKPRTTKLYIQADYSNSDLIIEKSDFVYAEAADNYCVIHYSKNDTLQKHIIRISLTNLLSQIQTDEIKKIHRSYIVNLKKVENFYGNSAGYKLSLFGTNNVLNVSRNYIESVLPTLKSL
jgi:hypothetical protein